MHEIGEFFGKNGFPAEEEICSDPAQIEHWLRSHDCLIVGSLRKNSAGEVVFYKLFGA